MNIMIHGVSCWVWTRVGEFGMMTAMVNVCVGPLGSFFSYQSFLGFSNHCWRFMLWVYSDCFSSSMLKQKASPGFGNGPPPARALATPADYAKTSTPAPRQTFLARSSPYIPITSPATTERFISGKVTIEHTEVAARRTEWERQSHLTTHEMEEELQQAEDDLLRAAASLEQSIRNDQATCGDMQDEQDYQEDPDIEDSTTRSRLRNGSTLRKP